MYKITRFWYKLLAKIEKFFYQNEPVICASCSKIIRRKNSIVEQSLTGHWVRICKSCRERIFGA